jgi:hypothetical protein
MTKPIGSIGTGVSFIANPNAFFMDRRPRPRPWSDGIGSRWGRERKESVSSVRTSAFERVGASWRERIGVRDFKVVCEVRVYFEVCGGGLVDNLILLGFGVTYSVDEFF